MTDAGSTAPLVRLRNLTKIYGTSGGEAEVRAVRAVSLDIDRGDFVAIMGPSGSGKSSLMNMLGLLDQATTGEYLFDGVPVTGLDRRELAVLRNAKLGFVFQSFNLLARMSALENVELPLLYTVAAVTPRKRRQRARGALERVGLGRRLGHLPNQLSGGEQQRVAIARALVTQPELLLADEPTGNLDTRTGIEITGLFQELNESGLTLVMVTHELDIAGYGRRIIVMRDGQVVRDGRNAQRRVLADELKSLDCAEQQAKLA